MRQFVTLIIVFTIASSCFSVLADTITMQDGSEVEGKVLKISESEIVYTLPGQDIERYINKTSVFKIRYDDGSDETINPIRSNTTEDEVILCTGVKPTFSTDYSHLPRASRKYSLYDYFNENGIEGIVIEVADEGYHGKVLALEEFKGKYAEDNVIEPFATDGKSLKDGEINGKTLTDKIASNNTLSPDDFPAHKWVSSLGSGWYIPSYGEMLKMIWLFETKDANGKSMKKLLNKIIKSHNGTPVHPYDYYGTSSECGNYTTYTLSGFGLLSSWVPVFNINGIYKFCMGKTKNLIKSTENSEGCSRYDKLRFRALHKF